MKKVTIYTASLLTIFVLTISGTAAVAQDLTGPGNGVNNKKENPIFKQIAGLDVIKTVYANASAVEKVNNVWFKIVDEGKNLLGYTLSSKAYSEDIIGYHNTTPVIVITDKNKVIQKVALLSNWESLAYTKKLERQNFFNTWNGVSLADASAKKPTPDSYSGATYTASAVKKNMEKVVAAANANKIK